MHLIKKLNLEVFLISITPLLAIFSIFFLEFSLLLVSIIFIIDTLKKKDFSTFNNLFFKVFCVFYFYLILRLLFANHLFQEIISIFFYFRFGIYTLAIFVS